MMCSDSIVVSSSKIEMSKTLEILTQTALSENVRKQVASDMPSSQAVHVSRQVTVLLWCCCTFYGWITLNTRMAGNACDKHFITFKHTSLLNYSSGHILKEFGMWIWCCISGKVFMHDITNLTFISEAESVMWQWIVLLNCVSQRTWREALV